MTELVPLREQDLDQVLSWRNAPGVRKNMYNAHEIAVDEHHQWFQRVSASASDQVFICRHDGRAIGVVNFRDYRRRSNNSDWGFYAAPDASPGTSVRLEYAALYHAFESMQLHKLNCEVIAYNREVINLHKKTGFVVEGIFRDFHYYDGHYHDVIRFGMLNSEWPLARGKLEARLAKLDNRS